MKKLSALILTVTMIFSLAVPGFAAETEKEVYDDYPVVIARGISFTGLVDLDTGKPAMEFDAESLIPLVLDFILARFALKNKAALAETLVKFLWDYMGPISGNPDGTSKYNVGVKQYDSNVSDFPGLGTGGNPTGENGLLMSVVKEIGAENTYYFRYDWRKSPKELAAELKDLVEIAKKQSGKDKVKIAAASMGAMITTAYMYYYGNESIDSITYLSSAANGVMACGDAYNGRISVRPDDLLALLDQYITGDYEFILKLLLKVADMLGAVDLLCDTVNDFVKNNTEYVYSECLRDLFGTAVGMWSLCPDEDFKSGINFIFGGHEDEYPVLMEKLKETEKFLDSTEEINLDAYNNGVKISVVSGYNYPMFPVYPRSNLTGDGVVETELSSFFATAASSGETLSDEYIAGKDSKYISADKMIDASTGLFKDSTWFIKNAGHVSCTYGSDAAELVVTLITSETQPTLASLPEYPQFLVADDALNFVE